MLSVASHLESRQLKGRYVVLEGKADYELITALYAVISVGAVAAVLNLDLSQEEIFYAMNQMQPALIISSLENYDFAEEYAKEYKIDAIVGEMKGNEQSIKAWIQKEESSFSYQRDQKPSDPALVLMTSGSTSKSKLVLLSHYTFLPSKEFFAPKNILLFPMYHMAGIVVVTNAIAKGVHTCLSNMKEGLRDLDWFQPNEVSAVPAFIAAMVKRSRQNLLDLSQYKYITSTGAPQNLEIAQYLSSLGIFSLSAYGSTETGGQVAYSAPGLGRLGSVGKVGPWNEIKISELGEILVKGNSIMLEYLGNPKETEEVLKDGWYHTGDVGYIDEDGFLYITGRMKNVIILSNGENVSPEAIEAQLYHCTDITEVVVCGEDNLIAAHIWCGKHPEEDIRKRVENYIAGYNRTVPTYRCIRKIVFREEAFAKTASGKIKR